MALLHHWPMDENTGSTLHDIVGGLDYVLPGLIGWEAGYKNHAASYFQKITGGNVPSQVHDFGVLTEMSISLWTRASQLMSTQGGYVLFNGEDVYWWSDGVNQLPYGNNIPTTFDAWTHYVWTTKNGGTQNFYKNGVLSDTDAPLNFPAGRFLSFRLGSFGLNSFYAPGTMQDCMIYDNELTQVQITALYNSQVESGNELPANVPLADLKCFYKLDSLSGQFIKDYSPARIYALRGAGISFTYDSVTNHKPGGAIINSALHQTGQVFLSEQISYWDKDKFTMSWFYKTDVVASIWANVWFGHWNNGGAGGNGFYLAAHSDKIRLAINTAAGPSEVVYDSSLPEIREFWQLYTVTFDMTYGGNGTVKNYIDGKLFSTMNTVTPYLHPTEKIAILNAWFGSMQWFGYWGRILTDAEISTLYSDAVSSNGISGSFLASDGCSNQINPGYYNPLIHRF